MNTDAVAQPRSDPQPVATITPLGRFLWSVRCEIWENRSIYLAPLAAAGLIVAAFVIRLGSLPETLRSAVVLDALHREAALEQPYIFAAMLFMFVTMVVGVVYCLDALYGERRDRSVLFWKSLPVSDTTAVLAKASVPLVVLPLVTFAATVATQATMLLLAGVRLIGTGTSVWAQLPFGRMTTILFYHLLLGHGLWYAPFWGWLLLMSAASRRTPLVWAALPLLVLGIGERIAFGTSRFGTLLGDRLLGGPAATTATGEPMTMASITPGSPADFLVSPGFWIGLAITAAFLAAAVLLRRRQGPV